MGISDGLAFTYRKTWAFLRKAWWLVPFPVLPTLIYDLAVLHSMVPQEQLTSANSLSIVLGNILAVASTYWAIRFIALDESVFEANCVNVRSAQTFAPYLACLSAIWIGISLAAEAGWLSVLLLGLLSVLVESLSAPWSVMAPSGSHALGPIRSVKVAWRKLPWAMLFSIVLSLPFGMVVLIVELMGSPRELWAFTAYLFGEHLTWGAVLVLNNVAVFVIAHRMGVRINNVQSVEGVFD